MHLYLYTKHVLVIFGAPQRSQVGFFGNQDDCARWVISNTEMMKTCGNATLAANSVTGTVTRLVHQCMRLTAFALLRSFTVARTRSHMKLIIETVARTVPQSATAAPHTCTAGSYLTPHNYRKPSDHHAAFGRAAVALIAPLSVRDAELRVNLWV